MPDEPTPTSDDSGAAGAGAEERVNFGGRVRASVRLRARVYAASHEMELQDVLDQALDEWLRKRGG